MAKGYQEIHPGILGYIKENAWSIENMEAHGAGGREASYIGSELGGDVAEGGKMLYDYYRDAAGAYWYGTRVLMPDGRAIGMEVYIFGKKLKKVRKRQ